MKTRSEPRPVPTVPGYARVRRLAGGHTNELFLASGPDGSDVVLRVFGAGTRRRGPEAPAVQAGVLRLVHGLVPAPELLEQRADLLATTKLDGTNLRGVLRTASPATQERLGTAMGEVLGRQDIEPEITGNYRVGDIRHCFADITLARRVLGYEPAMPLEQGLIELASWLKGQVACDRVAEAREELAARGLTV